MNGPQQTACFSKVMHNYTFLNTVHISHCVITRHWQMLMVWCGCMVGQMETVAANRKNDIF